MAQLSGRNQGPDKPFYDIHEETGADARAHGRHDFLNACILYQFPEGTEIHDALMSHAVYLSLCIFVMLANCGINNSSAAVHIRVI